ncbi:Solute carrier family 35 member E3 [Pseudocercospora fuligena]|uniref:GDP-mannose transporter n=1 Tax=Pseudocercospora fuligena TaxID=685502 RepID=A0A8H6VCB7_9PEZI|nr:Solute carrier family 35 member E3 [Pseudocercospora fuligena]
MMPSSSSTPRTSEWPGSIQKLHKRETALFWIVINVLATVVIVFVNKAIFDDKKLGSIQISFATFHFLMTWLGLRILSLDRFAFFEPEKVSVTQVAPLSLAMTLNVIFPNLSLAYSTVAFYQIARVLVSPCVAILDYVLHRATISPLASLALASACLGVAMTSYYDSRPSTDARVKMTSGLGVMFALVGVFFSSLYTVWINAFRRKLKVSSMQLLLNQAPVSALLLLYAIPWIDTFPHTSEVNVNRWILIVISGASAMLINVSQFFIIAQSGAVTSTVVGHSKTCVIVILSWASSGRGMTDMSVVGLSIALVGILW